MAQSLNKNTFDTVYKDDFIDSDNYYRILFNSGKKLQARELTQAQTIIQNQIKRFGSNIFKDNSLIKGGEADIDNAYELCKDLTRNNQCITMDDITVFIKNLDIDEKIKTELYEITVETYIGNAEKTF